jgi:hypothetical protein
VDLHEFLVRYGYIPLAAIAGAITSLAVARSQDMTKTDMVLTFTVGFSFAIFVTPWIAVSVFGIEAANIRAIAGLTYVFGAGSNILLPVLIDWVKHFFRVAPGERNTPQ